MDAVRDRLTKEITYWDHRALDLKEQERAGKQPKMNAAMAERRADELQARLRKRMEELQQERQVSALPPVVVGGALVVPAGALTSRVVGPDGADAAARRAEVERLAMEAVLAAERRLGRIPTDVSARKLGYDVESEVPGEGRLLFIEVKGRADGADTVTVTKNEILTALNMHDLPGQRPAPCTAACPRHRGRARAAGRGTAGRVRRRLQRCAGPALRAPDLPVQRQPPLLVRHAPQPAPHG
jgi:hypothetical protein